MQSPGPAAYLLDPWACVQPPLGLFWKGERKSTLPTMARWKQVFPLCPLWARRYGSIHAVAPADLGQQVIAGVPTNSANLFFLPRRLAADPSAQNLRQSVVKIRVGEKSPVPSR